MIAAEMERIREELLAKRKLNDGNLLMEIIQEDVASSEKRAMREGERYYRCQHDVLGHNFQTRPVAEEVLREDGTEREGVLPFSNPNRSNHHCVNPFHRILVDQKAAYLVSREPSITVRAAASKEAAEMERFFCDAADEEWNRMLSDWVVEAANKGVGYLHLYYDEEGILRYAVVPSEQVIPIYSSPYQKELAGVIRYYDWEVMEERHRVTRRRVEWWNEKEVLYFQEDERGRLAAKGTAAHWVTATLLDGEEVNSEAHGWGQVPFIPLNNNAAQMSDLVQIKGLVDAYDYLSSEGTNNLLDLVELYWVIAGYGGETAGAIAKKLQINKAVHISDASGKVEAKQVALPMEGRLAWMRMLRKDIFHFGMGVDTDSENLGRAPSGVSLKFQYAMFHLKVNGIVPEIRRALRGFFRFLAEDSNRRYGTGYDAEAVEISLNLSVVSDDRETMEIIAMSKDMVSEKTLLGKHPLIDDVNAELKQLMEATLRVRSIDACPIIRVPSARLKTEYTFLDGVTEGGKAGGFAPTVGAKNINWILAVRHAPIAVSKTDVTRIFDPLTNQRANAWKIDYRKYHDLWIGEHGMEGIWVNVDNG